MVSGGLLTRSCSTNPVQAGNSVIYRYAFTDLAVVRGGSAKVTGTLNLRQEATWASGVSRLALHIGSAKVYLHLSTCTCICVRT